MNIRLPLFALAMTCGLPGSGFAWQSEEVVPPVSEVLAAALPAPEVVLAKVNGRDVTGAQVRIRMLTAPAAEQAAPKPLEAYVQLAIDRLLIEQFLKSRKVAVPDELVQSGVAAFTLRAEQATGDSVAALSRLGLDEHSLEHTVRLSLAWLKHAQQTLTDDQFRAYFAAHREELDGTRVTISYVYMPIKPDADAAAWDAAQVQLTNPATRDEFGEPVTTAFLGILPPEVTHAAFALKPGAISEVIRCARGLYVLQVGERIPGQLSLEDVRLTVLSVLSQGLWDEEVARQRQTARIQLLLP